MPVARLIVGFWLALVLALLGGPVWAVTISPGVEIGKISALSEVSGIVGGRSAANTAWVHNDSGDSPRFYAISTAPGTVGALTGTFSLQGAPNGDWEDIAIGPKPGGGNYLYLGDVGDNSPFDRTPVVYRVTEPSVPTGTNTITAANYQKATLAYPGGPRNTESLMVDPWTSDVFLITKQPSGQVYSFPSSAFGAAGTTTMTSWGTLSVPISEPSGADISPDGRFILVRDRSTTAYLFVRSSGQSVWDALSGPAINVTLRSETQGEAIGWLGDGSGFYTTSEQDSDGPRPLYFYAFVPEPASGQLIGCGAVLLVVAAIGGQVRRVRCA